MSLCERVPGWNISVCQLPSTCAGIPQQASTMYLFLRPQLLWSMGTVGVCQAVGVEGSRSCIQLSVCRGASRYAAWYTETGDLSMSLPQAQTRDKTD